MSTPTMYERKLAEIKALEVRLAEAEALLREARDDVVEASNHTHKPHAVAYYKDQIARIDAFLGVGLVPTPVADTDRGEEHGQE